MVVGSKLLSLQAIEEGAELRLPEDVCKNILKYSLSTDAKPYTIVLAAFVVLLHKYTREEDMLLGSSSSNFNPLVLRMWIGVAKRIAVGSHAGVCTQA